jgi:hypothetical protein
MIMTQEPKLLLSLLIISTMIQQIDDLRNGNDRMGTFKQKVKVSRI